MLREDNADLRLTELGRELGLVDDARWQAFETYREQLERLNQTMRDLWVRPNTAESQGLDQVLKNQVTREYRFIDILKRPEVGIKHLMPFVEAADSYAQPVREQAEINAKYAGYLSRQQQEIDKTSQQQKTTLPFMQKDFSPRS